MSFLMQVSDETFVFLNQWGESYILGLSRLTRTVKRIQGPWCRPSVGVETTRSGQRGSEESEERSHPDKASVPSTTPENIPVSLHCSSEAGALKLHADLVPDDARRRDEVRGCPTYGH